MAGPISSFATSTNFPKPAATRQIDSMSFPNDLVADGRNFYTEILAVDYQAAFNAIPPGASILDWFSTILTNIQSNIPIVGVPGLNLNNLPNGNVLRPSGGYRLPIPLKVNEALTLSWNTVSLTSIAAQFAGQAIGNAVFAPGSPLAGQSIQGIAQSASQALGVGGIFTGLAVNPNLFMQFQQPNFKEYVLRWSLAPRTIEESKTIQSMITAFKQAASPTYNGVAVLGYPKVLLIRMMPNDMFGNLNFKPCAITSVNVDYTPAGPAFFKHTGAPTIVSLTLNLKEIFLWFRDQIGTTATPGIDIQGGGA